MFHARRSEVHNVHGMHTFVYYSGMPVSGLDLDRSGLYIAFAFA